MSRSPRSPISRERSLFGRAIRFTGRQMLMVSVVVGLICAAGVVIGLIGWGAVGIYHCIFPITLFKLFRAIGVIVLIIVAWVLMLIASAAKDG